MDNNTGTKRLSKVAIELNVGVHTLIDFLNSEGFPVEGPNAKINEETYNTLLKEFHSDKTVKQESMKINLKPQEIENVKKDIIEKNVAKEEKNVAQNNIKPVKEPTISTTVEEEKKVVAPETVIIEKEETIFDNIDPKEDSPIIDEEPPVEDNNEKKFGPKIVGKIDLTAFDKKPVKKETPKQPPIKQDTVKQKPVNEEPLQEETIKEEIIVTVEENISEEKTPIIDSKLETNQKIVSHETTETINTENTIIHQETKEDIIEPVIINEESEKPHEEIITKPEIIEEAEEDSNHIKTQFQKLTGPKIIDKIDLSSFDKKPTKQEKEAEKKKNKKNRPRITKKPENIDRDANKDQKPQTDRNNNNNNNNSNNNRNKNSNSNNSNNNNRNKNNNNNTKGRKKEVRPEINEIDINRHIKETLAQLQSGSTKSRGSKYRRLKRDAYQEREMEKMEQAELDKNILKLNEFITVSELASLMNVPATKVISSCMSLGLIVSLNQRLDAEAITIVALEFGYEVQFISIDDKEEEEEPDENPANLEPRAPVVTVMGHVDHGKTSLLDYIRSTNVIAGESGGITQHIGAYEFILENGRKITFLDTPGHEAFTAMRARGAKITDIAIIVIAADDQVMPQTIEAINHAKAAEVPMVFAINKIDKQGANPEKIKEQLANMNLLVEDWGGKYQSQEISAKKGLNIDKLLEKVLLEADILELKANPNRLASGTVVEASLDKGRGYLATVLVQNGTLHIGDIILAGSYFGRVKAMFNERNQALKVAGPSTPVLLLGLNGAPTAGDTFKVYEDERDAKDIAFKRQQLIREQSLRTQKHITLDEIGRRIAIGEFKELNIIVKGDVVGSIEALSDSLQKLSTDNIQVNIIHTAVGGINESDVLLATASNAIIVGFQVRPSLSARKLAEKEEIEIRTYSIIYDAIDEIKSAIEGMLEPKMVEKVVANIEVREVFKVSKVGTIAGCMVLDGKIIKSHKIRIIRDGIVVVTGEISSLKRFKDDVKEVVSGQDCGIGILNFNDIKTGDIIEAFTQVEEKRK